MALSQALTQSARAYAACMEDPRIAPLLANVDKHDVMGQSDGAGAELLGPDGAREKVTPAMVDALAQWTKSRHSCGCSHVWQLISNRPRQLSVGSGVHATGSARTWQSENATSVVRAARTRG